MVHLWGVGGGQQTGSIREERIKEVESNIRKVVGRGRIIRKIHNKVPRDGSQQKRGQDWD